MSKGLEVGDKVKNLSGDITGKIIFVEEFLRMHLVKDFEDRLFILEEKHLKLME